MSDKTEKMLKFKCPQCGGDILEEQMINCTQDTIIIAIHESGAVDYGDYSVDLGDVERYICTGCGYGLVEDPSENDPFADAYAVSTNSGLVKWLKENCPQD
jgi:hypothetical protein